LETIKNWQELAEQSKRDRMPIIVMIDQEDCPFCRRGEGEFFAAIFAGGEFDNRALFGKMSINAGDSIINLEGRSESVESFLADLNTHFTPTILFLDANKTELTKKMVGLSTPDFYGFYLERGIKQSIAALA